MLLALRSLYEAAARGGGWLSPEQVRRQKREEELRLARQVAEEQDLERTVRAAHPENKAQEAARPVAAVVAHPRLKTPSLAPAEALPADDDEDLLLLLAA